MFGYSQNVEQFIKTTMNNDSVDFNYLFQNASPDAIKKYYDSFGTYANTLIPKMANTSGHGAQTF